MILFIYLFICLFITLFTVGTLKLLIANKNQPLNITTKKTKTIIIIAQMNAYDYTVIITFGILNNCYAISISEILYVIFKFTNWSAGFYVTR